MEQIKSEITELIVVAERNMQALIEEAGRLIGELSEKYKDNESYTIESTQQAEEMQGMLKVILQDSKAIEANQKAIVAPVKALKTAIDKLYDGPETLIATRQVAIKSALKKWADHIDAINRENMRKAQEEAAKERAKLEKKADTAESKGKEEKAEDLRMQAETIVPQAIQQSSGVKTAKIWKWRITDFSKIPDEYKTTNDGMITGVVKAMKEQTNIPGIEAYPETITRA